MTAVMSDFADVQVVDIYDGDTFFVDIEGLPEVFGKRMKIRIKGIDTPEIRDARQCGKKDARMARDRLAALMFGQTVNLYHCEAGKYYAIVCNVQAGPIDAGGYLLAQGWALPYGGGTKIKWKCRR